jgi:hypothetical protein
MGSMSTDDPQNDRNGGNDTDVKAYEGLSALVFLVGIYQGVVPFVVRLLAGEDGRQFLSLPTRLDGPWWWVAAIASLAVAAVLLELIDRAKKRALANPPGASRTSGGRRARR